MPRAKVQKPADDTLVQATYKITKKQKEALRQQAAESDLSASQVLRSILRALLGGKGGDSGSDTGS